MIYKRLSNIFPNCVYQVSEPVKCIVVAAAHTDKECNGDHQAQSNYLVDARCVYTEFKEREKITDPKIQNIFIIAYDFIMLKAFFFLVCGEVSQQTNFSCCFEPQNSKEEGQKLDRVDYCWKIYTIPVSFISPVNRCGVMRCAALAHATAIHLHQSWSEWIERKKKKCAMPAK